MKYQRFPGAAGNSAAPGRKTGRFFRRVQPGK